MLPEIKIPPEQLIAKNRRESWSAIAYRRNRGLDSYKTMIGLDLPSEAEAAINSKGFFRWVDMCCGEFRAGKELAEKIAPSQKGKFELIGVEIDIRDQDHFKSATKIRQGNAVTYPVPAGVDLITCVNGIWLINKFMGLSEVSHAIENWYNSLSVGGKLVMTADNSLIGLDRPFSILDSLRDQLGDAVKRGFTSNDFRFCEEYLDFVSVTKPNSAPIHLPRK